MSLSERDKKIVIVIVPLVVVLGYWFLLLAPKREAASSAAAELETVQAELAQAQTQATTVQAAKTNFARDYAAVVALGKAIPTSVDMPSLLVQLEQAARGTGIKFEGITMGERTAPEALPTGGAAPAPGAAAPAPAPPAGAAPSGQPPQSAPGQAAASAQGAADAASAPPPGGTSGTAAAPGDPAAAGAGGPGHRRRRARDGHARVRLHRQLLRDGQPLPPPEALRLHGRREGACAAVAS